MILGGNDCIQLRLDPREAFFHVIDAAVVKKEAGHRSRKHTDKSDPEQHQSAHLLPARLNCSSR
jgi:hypothetical protein